MRRVGIYIFLGIIIVTILYVSEHHAQNLLSLAAPKQANIIIKNNIRLGSINRSWSNFAQGGEEPPPMLTSVISPLKDLSPSYIRIDHIFDSYSIVEKNTSGFTYDFSRLDQTVNDILASGALPFFSLSYMPSVFTATRSIIDSPSNWLYWKDLIKATVEHYSGRNNKNINKIYYEVWNEPELPQFGNWKLSGEKDYRLLYSNAVAAAQEAENTNQFFIGGPSVGSYYPNWIHPFLSYISQNNIRLDFYSWHRYVKNPDIFISDIKNTRKDLAKYPQYSNLPLVISEWGIDSQNTDINSSNIAAAFTINSIAKFYKDLALAFAFEIKDGPPPQGGKWGIITHENNPEKKLFLKPRYHAFSALSQLTGEQLEIIGEGTYISALASISSTNVITVVMSNYDIKGKNIEQVPITFTDLPALVYKLRYVYPLDQSEGEYELVSTNGTLSKSFLMPVNSILILQLTPSSELANFTKGAGTQIHDQALLLNRNLVPLVFNFPEFRLLPVGQISFDLQEFWEQSDTNTFYIFEAPYSVAENRVDKLFLVKKNESGTNSLVFGTSTDGEDIIVVSSIADWQKDSWHHIRLGWNQSGLSIKIDDQQEIITQIPLQIRNGKTLMFSQIDAAIDNVVLTIGKEQSIKRLFDGSVEK